MKSFKVMLLMMTQISLISGSYADEKKSACVYVESTFNEHNSLLTRGNGDRRLSPFEIAELTVIFRVPPSSDVTISIEDSPEISLLSTFTKSYVSPKDNLLQIKQLLTTKVDKSLQHRNKVSFQISCNHEPLTVTIPYQHALGDDLELTQKDRQIKAFDFKNKAQLDRFLDRYPSSERAPFILALRMKLLKERAAEAIKTNSESEVIEAINEYHDFIERYATTVGAELAIHEVFKLYQKQDSISAYAEFIHRYPRSLEASLSYEHLKRKAYEATINQNDLNAYDAFLESFPDDTLYIDVLIKRARVIALRQEEQAFQEIKAQIPQNDVYEIKLIYERDDHTAQLYHVWQEASQTSITPQNALVIKERMARIEHIISNLYPMTPSYQILSVRKQLDEIQAQLTRIEESITQQHQEALQALESSFNTLRQDLNKGFDKMSGHFTAIEERLKRQEKSIEALDQRFDDLNRLVETHYQSLKQQSGNLRSDLKHLKELGLAESVLIALKIGLEGYDVYKKTYQPSSKNSYHLTLSPKLKLALNQKSKPAFQARSWLKMACPAAATSLTGLLSVSGPIAVGTGTAARFACQWGVDQVVNWWHR